MTDKQTLKEKMKEVSDLPITEKSLTSSHYSFNNGLASYSNNYLSQKNLEPLVISALEKYSRVD